MLNAVSERIHQVLGDKVRNFNTLAQTYIDKDDPWTSILSAAAFAIRLTANRQKGYSPVKLLFGHSMILQIKHAVDWELTG